MKNAFSVISNLHNIIEYIHVPAFLIVTYVHDQKTKIMYHLTVSTKSNMKAIVVFVK